MHTARSTTIASANTRLTGVWTPTRSDSQNASPGNAPSRRTASVRRIQTAAYFSRIRRRRSSATSATASVTQTITART
jgi:hypothetical protein